MKLISFVPILVILSWSWKKMRTKYRREMGRQDSNPRLGIVKMNWNMDWKKKLGAVSVDYNWRETEMKQRDCVMSSTSFSSCSCAVSWFSWSSSSSLFRDETNRFNFINRKKSWVWTSHQLLSLPWPTRHFRLCFFFSSLTWTVISSMILSSLIHLFRCNSPTHRCGVSITRCYPYPYRYQLIIVHLIWSRLIDYYSWMQSNISETFNWNQTGIFDSSHVEWMN